MRSEKLIELFIRKFGRLHDVPLNIVSVNVWGFTLRFWKAFQNAMGIIVSWVRLTAHEPWVVRIGQYGYRKFWSYVLNFERIWDEHPPLVGLLTIVAALVALVRCLFRMLFFCVGLNRSFGFVTVTPWRWNSFWWEGESWILRHMRSFEIPWKGVGIIAWNVGLIW